MDYVYLVEEEGGAPLGAWTKKYHLKWWLEKYFESHTSFGGLKCYRIRGGSVTEIDPYQVVKVDPGEL